MSWEPNKIFRFRYRLVSNHVDSQRLKQDLRKNWLVIRESLVIIWFSVGIDRLCFFEVVSLLLVKKANLIIEKLKLVKIKMEGRMKQWAPFFFD